MKIILATDPIFWPLTGIGKYTLELAKRFGCDPRVDDIRFFNLGHWQDSASIQAFEHGHRGEPSSKNTVQKGFGFIRETLAKNRSAVKAYSHITPYLYQRRLKPFASEYIYHGPNFMLPLYDGRKVVTFHDLSILKFPEFHPEARVSYVRPQIMSAAARADHIITVSEAVRWEVIEHFACPPEKVTAIPEAPCLNTRTPDALVMKRFLQAHGLQEKQFFLFVSSIEPRKNIDRILDAYCSQPSAFRRQHPLVLTGSSGWKSEAIMQRISSLSGSGSVRYLGYTSDEELKYLYCVAGALVFPSIYEGFGLPIVEAQSMGVPVLTSDLSCMPEVSGKAALLVNPYDVDELSRAMERIMSDEQIRNELIAKGLENAAKFSWNATVSRTLEVYSRL